MTDPTPAAPEDLGARVGLLRQYAAERAQLGDTAEVHRAGDALLSLDGDALGRAEPGITRDMLDAVPSLLAAGDFQRAEMLLLKGIRALSINPHATQVDQIVPLNNLMAVYDQKGDSGQRNQAAAAIGSLVERLDEPLTPRAADALLQLGALFEQGGNIGATLVMYRPVHAYMTARADIAPDSLLAWLMTYAGALMAGAHYDDVIAVGTQALGVVHDGRQIAILAIIATAATRKGDAAAAEAALERGADVAETVEAAAGPTDAQMEHAAGAVYHNLAAHYLGQHRSERYARAEELMRRALAIVLRRGGEGSGEHAGALGQLAVITEARGDLDAAERLYGESVAVYETAPDSPSAEFSNFLTDLGLLRLRRGRANEAVAPLRRVVELREAAEGETPVRRADAASNLATAYFEAGDLARARQEYTRAIDRRFAGQG
jgi:tetratricopeptide (TPR) repeat protein